MNTQKKIKKCVKFLTAMTPLTPWTLLLIAWVTLLGVGFYVRDGYAAPESASAAKSPAASEGKSKVLRFDTLTITGDAAKPNVFYLLNRKKILIRHEPERRDLLINIEKSVEGRPF